MGVWTQLKGEHRIGMGEPSSLGCSGGRIENSEGPATSGGTVCRQQPRAVGRKRQRGNLADERIGDRAQGSSGRDLPPGQLPKCPGNELCPIR